MWVRCRQVLSEAEKTGFLFLTIWIFWQWIRATLLAGLRTSCSVSPVLGSRREPPPLWIRKLVLSTGEMGWLNEESFKLILFFRFQKKKKLTQASGDHPVKWPWLVWSILRCSEPCTGSVYTCRMRTRCKTNWFRQVHGHLQFFSPLNVFDCVLNLSKESCIFFLHL